ncbi:MAG: divalent metal cation transporter, partial [Verrucomicrobiae bacterium]|nr:divalent metal cation transporter [Verrucomicrobiae bacterium]
VKRDAFNLSDALTTLTGPQFSQIIFGIGVVGMAISTIIILMLINGFAICELFGKPATGLLYQAGCILAAVAGAFGALFLWSGKAQFYLAVPTSRFGMVLLPIAYIAFFFLMNNRKLLGENMPKGASRFGWNLLMSIAVLLALSGATISILNDKAMIPGTGIAVKTVGLVILAILFAWAVIVHFKRKSA